MVTLSQSPRPGEFIITEAAGTRSRDTVTIEAGQNLEVSAVLGRITGTGKCVALDPLASDGSEVATGILYANTDATAGDINAVIVARDAEVRESDLDFNGADQAQIDTAKIELDDLNIIVR